MINLDFNFSDLISEKKYAILQNRFYWNDIRNDDIELKATVPIRNFSIRVKEDDLKAEKDIYLDINFEDDFLKTGISKLAEKNSLIFIDKIKELYTEELKNGFVRQYVEELRNTKDLILYSKFLNQDIMKSIISEILKLEEFVFSYLSNPYPSIKEKLEFNWSNTDVVFFFHLLRENKVINHITDADLGRIIDSFCKGSDNDSDTYFDMKYSSKLINNFKNRSRSNSEPLKRLKEVFSNNDFFNV